MYKAKNHINFIKHFLFISIKVYMNFNLCNNFFYRLKGESENELYKKFNTSKENLLRNNNSIKPYAGEWVKIKQNNYTTHIVKPAENLAKVCAIYKVDENSIISWNNLKSNKLFIGQHLKIFNIK